MGCESNHFCSSLSEGVRRKLCAKCSRQLLGAGSIENYLDTHKHAFILLDGFITGTGYGDTNLKNWPDVLLSRTIIVTPGYLVGWHGTLARENDIMFASSFVRCETDCCIARFSHSLLDELARDYAQVAHGAAQSAFELSISTSEFLNIALMPSVGKKVEAFLAFLAKCGAYCSETRIAEILGCSRTSVSRAFTAISKENPALFEAFNENKGRVILLQEPA